jgi:hypothetical protein
VRPNVSAKKEQGYGVVRSFNAFAVQADPDTICRGGAEPGVQALVDDRVLRFEEQLFGEDRVSGVGRPYSHAVSQTPSGPCGFTLDRDIGCLDTAFDHPRRVMRALV